MTPDFHALGLPINIALFCAAVIVVWRAGVRMAGYAAAVSERTGAGDALVGLVLLAGVTSLPEIATSFSAAAGDDAELAVNNLLGSIAMQVAVLALADLLIGKHALTAVVPDPRVMLQGALNICLLLFVVAAILVGDTLVIGVGAWVWGLFTAAVYAFWKLFETDREEPAWSPRIAPPDETLPLSPPEGRDYSAAGLTARIIIAGALILAAGFIVARTGDAIAEQSGIGASFMGVAFVAIATSLPETSTVFAAMRLRRYTMAISDILGTNILNVALLFGVDAVAGGEPVLNRVGDFGALAATLAAVLTAFFLMGLAERRDRSILRMGEDSLLVLVTYAGGLALLYTLR